MIFYKLRIICLHLFGPWHPWKARSLHLPSFKKRYKFHFFVLNDERNGKGKGNLTQTHMHHATTHNRILRSSFSLAIRTNFRMSKIEYNVHIIYSYFSILTTTNSLRGCHGKTNERKRAKADNFHRQMERHLLIQKNSPHVKAKARCLGILKTYFIISKRRHS